MVKPRKAIVTKERTVHMYAELWHASRCVLEVGLRQQKGSSWQFLSSILLTAFTFEAYLNHVGLRTILSWAALERLPPLSKFEFLCEVLSLDFPDGSSVRPLQTLSELLAFRNTMAHGRSMEIQIKPELRDADSRLDAYLGEQPLANWERLIKTDEFAKRAREDVEIVLRKMHAARKDEKESLFTFGTSIHGANLIEGP